MVKKGNKSATARRGSLVTVEDNIAIVDSKDHSKYSVARSHVESSKGILHWTDLKAECHNSDDIRNRVRRLPLDNVLPLLTELLASFDVQQARDTELTEWIKTVLLTHTAYFMSLPDVVQRLSTLYKELDDRLTVYPKLLAMHGRLDLIQNQVDARSRKVEESSDEEDAEEDEESVDEELSDSADGLEDEEGDADEDDLMDMDDAQEAKMFGEEEDDLNTEDEDDNISDSDIEE